MSTKPELPPAAIEEAKRHPNGWLYVIDPAFDPNGEVPWDGIVGAWKVDGEGNLTSEYFSNPDYVPRTPPAEPPPGQSAA
jgi:hypothetical protein